MFLLELHLDIVLEVLLVLKIEVLSDKTKRRLTEKVRMIDL